MTKFQVPDHILDMVVEQTHQYIENSFERAYGAAGDMSEADFRATSTHNVVDTPERRKLHTEILTSLTGDLIQKSEGKPKLIYIVGPMGAGKSTLRGMFDERIQEGPQSEDYGPGLEEAFQAYSQASAFLMDSDFDVYKAMLPEFEENGQNFGVIRAEASALDQACTQWAKELGANLILEQLCDGDMRETMAKFNADYEVFTIGLTADPCVNAERLVKRAEETGQEIGPEELASTIVGCSQEYGFPHMAESSANAVLISSESDYLQAIAQWTNGVRQVFNPEKLDRFESYGEIDPEALAILLKQEDDGAAAPSAPSV